MREEHVGLARQDQLDFEPAPGQPRHLAQGAAGRQKAGADNRNLPCAFEVSAQGQFDRIVPARAGEKNLAPGECDDPLPSRFAQAGKRLCLRLAPANISSEAAANSRGGRPRIFRPKSRQPDATLIVCDIFNCPQTQAAHLADPGRHGRGAPPRVGCLRSASAPQPHDKQAGWKNVTLE